MRSTKALWTSLILASAVSLVGCGGVLPGFRLSPGEQQKQSAQVGAELGVVAASSGLPPDSLAAKQLARSAYAGMTYMGPPEQPTDVSPLLPPAVTGAWATVQRQAEAYELKHNVRERTTEITAEALAALAADIEGESRVDADRVVFRAQAIIQGQKMGDEIAGVIPIPGLDILSPEEAERMKRLDKALDKIQSAAATQAARRPTAAEVVDAAEDQALGTADRVLGALEDWGLVGAVPGVGLAMLYGARKRKQAKASAEKTSKSEEDLKFARVRETQAKAAADAAVSAARAESAALATVAMERLAAAQPPIPANGTAVANGGTPQA